jgi:hypothetical protein
MSPRQLRARLDRLLLSAAIAGRDGDGARAFTIDPAVARALRNEQQQLSALIRKRSPARMAALSVLLRWRKNPRFVQASLTG